MQFKLKWSVTESWDSTENGIMCMCVCMCKQTYTYILILGRLIFYVNLFHLKTGHVILCFQNIFHSYNRIYSVHELYPLLILFSLHYHFQGIFFLLFIFPSMLLGRKNLLSLLSLFIHSHSIKYSYQY